MTSPSDPREEQKLLAALDSLLEAGESPELLLKTSQKLGLNWKPERD